MKIRIFSLVAVVAWLTFYVLVPPPSVARVTNLGIRECTSTVLYSVEISNPGFVDSQVVDVEPSCSCTRPLDRHLDLTPQSNGEIRMVFNTSTSEGLAEVDLIIRVHHLFRDIFLKTRVKVTTEKLIKFTPEKLVIFPTEHNITEAFTRKILVSLNERSGDFAQINVESLGVPGFDVNVDIVTPRTAEITVSHSPPQLQGLIDFPLVAHFKLREGSDVQKILSADTLRLLSLCGQFHSPLKAEPEYLIYDPKISGDLSCAIPTPKDIKQITLHGYIDRWSYEMNGDHNLTLSPKEIKGDIPAYRQQGWVLIEYRSNAPLVVPVYVRTLKQNPSSLAQKKTAEQ